MAGTGGADGVGHIRDARKWHLLFVLYEMKDCNLQASNGLVACYEHFHICYYSLVESLLYILTYAWLTVTYLVHLAYTWPTSELSASTLLNLFVGRAS